MVENYAQLLSKDAQQQIDVWVAKYPADQKRSVLLPALHIAQDENKGSLTEDLINAVADYLELPRVYAYEAVEFYSMYETKPVGRHKICVCSSICCMLRGSDDLFAHLKKKLGIEVNETTKDGKFTLKEVECLAACGGAPAIMINKTYHENLSPEKIDELLDNLE